MATDWHVEYQDTRPDIQTNGRLVQMVDVHFVIDTDPGSGHHDMVTIPESRYNADNVRALIDDKVARIKDTFNL